MFRFPSFVLYFRIRDSGHKMLITGGRNLWKMMKTKDV